MSTLGFQENKKNYALFVVILTVSVYSFCAAQGFAIEIRYKNNLELTQGKEGRLRPASIACDLTSGEMAVTESRQSAIHLFNEAGIETFVTSRFANLSLPLDAMVDLEGRLVCINKVADWGNSISRLNIYGEPDPFVPETPYENWNPDHLIVTRDGHYLTVDSNRGFLAKHDQATGQTLWVSRLGDDDMGESHLGRPYEMPTGEIMIPGGRLARIHIYSPEGTFIRAFGRFGSAPGRMVFPVAVAAGPQETILVLDRLRHKIIIFDATLAYLTEFGSLGSEPGQFYHPVSMAVNKHGEIFVAQGYKGRVQVFNLLGDKEN